MSDSNSTPSVPADKPAKPEKPYEGYPLTAHATRRWCKKIKGKIHYFGVWEDPAGALREYQDFLAGKPREKTNRPANNRPEKPYPGYPLTAHPVGQWCKKIRGKVHYFGPWSDEQGALDKYESMKDDLEAGRTPRPDPQALTVKDACNAFLDHKRDKVEAGELSRRTWAKYKEVTDVLMTRLRGSRLLSDLRSEDFAAIKNWMTKRWGPLRVTDMIQHVRSVFKHAFDADLIAMPIRFGPGFARPSQKVLRLHRAKQGPKLFAVEDVRRMVATAGPDMLPMLLLALNCGFGNADCAALPLTALDLNAGVVDFPRPKTGIPRRCILWPETVKALKDAIEDRPQPKGEAEAGLVFLSQRGTPLVSVRELDRTDAIAVRFGALLKTLGIKRRKSTGFYTLRHVHRTIADATKDQAACDRIMGHETGHVSVHYREVIEDARLKAVSDHVRRWLWPAQTADSPVPA
jgi:hypothetical protein